MTRPGDIGRHDRAIAREKWKDRLRNWLLPLIVGLLGLWYFAGAPPFGRRPYWERGLMNNNMGFGNDWDCPPNIKPSATVCIRRPRTTLPAKP